MPIWDTVVRSDVSPAQLARATTLFVGNEGPFYTRHRYPYEGKTFTDPRLVSSMLGEENTMPQYNYVGGVGDEIDELLKDVSEPAVPGKDIASVLDQPVVKPKVTVAPTVSPGSPPLKAAFPWLLVAGGAAAYFLFFRK